MPTDYNRIVVYCIIALLGWLIIPRIKRSIAVKAEAQNRIREFFDFVMQFKAEIVAPKLPDFWVSYSSKTHHG